MNVAIVNRRYFESSGPERYLLQIKDKFETEGHKVFPFSVKRKWNIESQYSDYFVMPPAGEDVLYFKDYRLTITQKLRLMMNAIYSIEAKKNIGKLIDDHDIDLIYGLGIVNDISPSIIDAAKKRGLPVVLRVSDYYIFCPEYRFMRDKKTCRECEKYGFIRALKYKCVQDSIAATSVRVISMYFHKWRKIYDKVDAFITPSHYMKETFLRAGFPEDKIHHIHSFFNAEDITPCYENDGYILYFGRIDADKGVINLIKAFEIGKFQMPLLIIGDAADGEDRRLMDYVRNKRLDNIKLLGFKNREELMPIIQRSKFVVVPSIWPDNSPNSILEAMSCGKPVIGSDLGGIAEQVTTECGILVPPSNPDSLVAAIESLISDPETIVNMGQKGVQKVRNEYSISMHYKKLNSLFNQLIKNKN